ncbi:hypothetical protein QE152_g37877 [Popillia japonica]|uniref:Uncharacterized protein n=1 Tax=Popillia japonica TaxID=7064 RepID=A0AAW1I8W5_POPJA
MGRTTTKTVKENSDKESVVISEDLQALIKSAINEATADLLAEIKELRNRVYDLETTNTKLLNNQNSKCINCELRENNHSLNSSRNSNTSTSTVIANSGEHMQAQKLEATKTLAGTKDVNSRRPPVNKTNRQKAADNRKNKIIGTNRKNHENSNYFFESPLRKLWLYVGRCKSGTSEDNIRTYLTKKIPDHEFDVVMLKSQGVNQSFRLAADPELKELLYDPAF